MLQCSRYVYRLLFGILEFGFNVLMGANYMSDMTYQVLKIATNNAHNPPRNLDYRPRHRVLVNVSRFIVKKNLLVSIAFISEIIRAFDN